MSDSMFYCLFFIAGKVVEKHGVYSQLTSNPSDVAAPLVILARWDAFLSSSFLVPQGGSACLKVVCLHELTVGSRHIVSTQHLVFETVCVSFSKPLTDSGNSVCINIPCTYHIFFDFLKAVD